MVPYKNSRFDDSIVDAMVISNTLDKQSGEKEKFNLIDAHIISVVHEHWCSGGRCVMSNNYFAVRTFTTEATIQKSINKLCGLNFISKRIQYIRGKRRRVIIYNQDTIEIFKSQMSNIVESVNK